MAGFACRQRPPTGVGGGGSETNEDDGDVGAAQHDDKVSTLLPPDDLHASDRRRRDDNAADARVYLKRICHLSGSPATTKDMILFIIFCPKTHNALQTFLRHGCNFVRTQCFH